MHVALVPTVDQFVDGTAGRGGIAAGDSGRTHHGTPARIHFKAAATAATADGTTHVDGNMTQFAAETVIAAHHTSLTDHRTADAHIGRHVDKRIGRFDLLRTFTLRGIAGDLRQRSGIGLIAGNRIKSFDHIELFEIQTFPTEIACAQQSLIIGDEPRQCQTGTGKHNNWSMSTTHENLLDPGDTPMENLQFLIFLAAVIKAVDEYADLLRTSVATPGNDHRLGANEAPPAIISIFVGEELEAVIDAIASDSPYAGPVKMKMDLGVDVLPKFSKDTTDRNRTSPFAFTGNKFEFRMPGSAENLSDCNTILNTAVAKELKGYADELEGAEDFTSAAIALIKRTIRDHRRVIFNGNGYTAEWEAEAAKRGLPNKKNTPAALPALVEPKNIQLMEEFGVLTKVEMESRYEVEMEHYSKIINIEALTMLEMARKQLLPAINAYMSEVANTAASKLAVSEHISVRSETKTLEKLSSDADAMSDAIDTLQDAVNAAKALPTESEKAVAFHDNVLPVMDALRAAADDAETICGEDYWPLPSYSKMLYYV